MVREPELARSWRSGQMVKAQKANAPVSPVGIDHLVRDWRGALATTVRMPIGM
jgi:hypothetical protein